MDRIGRLLLLVFLLFFFASQFFDIYWLRRHPTDRYEDVLEGIVAPRLKLSIDQNLVNICRILMISGPF